jgi:hypothetical protein
MPIKLSTTLLQFVIGSLNTVIAAFDADRCPSRSRPGRTLSTNLFVRIGCCGWRCPNSAHLRSSSYQCSHWYRQTLVLNRTRVVAKNGTQTRGSSRVRLSRLNVAARGCGRRGLYANSMLGWSRVAVCEGRVEAGTPWSRWTEQPFAVASRGKKVAEGAERKKLSGGKAQERGPCRGTRRIRIGESDFMLQS